MFGIDFFEFMVIAVVALIVLGPERLPKVARTVGLLMGRFQRYVSDVKADINREIHLEELRRLQAEVTETAQRIESDVRKELDTAKSSIESGAAAAVAELDAAAQSLQQASADTASQDNPSLPAAVTTPDTVPAVAVTAAVAPSSPSSPVSPDRPV